MQHSPTAGRKKMATDLATQIITPEQLAAMPNAKDFELVDGQLVEINMGNKASWVAFELASRLREWVRQNRLGWVFSADTGFRLDPQRPNLLRKPDVSFVRFGRLPNEQPADAYDYLAPDLVAESISPNDTFLEVEEKIDEYLIAGVRLLWIINPDLRTLKVYRLNGTTTTLRNGDEIDGEDVVPGFSCMLSELFELPIPKST
jgi:Uma2 family endonuclease